MLLDGIFYIPIDATSPIRSLAKFLAYLSKIDVDVVHLHFANWMTVFASIYFRFIKRRPIIITTHDPLIATGEQPLIITFKGFLKYLRRVPLKKIAKGIYQAIPFRCADAIIALSHAEKKLLVNYGLNPLKIYVIPNGVDLERFSMDVPKDYFRRKINIKTDYILNVAQFHPIKGQRYLLKALYILRKQYNVDVSVVIAGRLTFPSVLAELLLLAKHLSIENRVHFIPNITEEDLIAAYKGCKVFCLPSINEALPLVLLEAMANAKPIVASSVGGIASVVEDRVTGFLVPPRDPIKLAEALSKLCLDNQLYSKMSQAAKRRVEMLTWDNVVRRILKLYDRLIEEVS